MRKAKGTPVPTPSRELRANTTKPMSVRTATDGSKQIAGYAIVFNSRSSDLGGFVEICAPTMLTRTLKESPDILALRDHKSELLLGRSVAGTLQLSVDNVGLAFVITLPKTAIGDDTAENVRLGNLQGVSFGFQTVKDDWVVDSDGNVVRTVLDIVLFEVSVTSFPAYIATTVSSRSCPAKLRKHLKEELTRGAVRNDNDCDCDCDECEDDDCENCSNDDCDDPNCEDCNQQTRSAHLGLLMRRLRA